MEFNHCGNQPSPNAFETICSFANRQEGSLLLSVLDDVTAEGIPEECVVPIERNLVNVTCNPRLFNVSLAIECEHIPLRGWPRRPARVGAHGTVRRHLTRMVGDGELRVVGGGRSTRYIAGGTHGEYPQNTRPTT